MNYYPWEHDEDLAVISRIPASINDHFWKLHEGISCQGWFPEEVLFEVDPNRGIKLADSIPNSLNLYIVSEKLCEILAAADTSFEFLEVGILNTKGKNVGKKYYIANLVGSLMCMDADQSDFEQSNLDKKQVSWFRRLVLDESKIPEDKQVIRLGEMTELLLVSEELAIKIVREGKCSGVSLTYIEDYGEEFR